MIEHDITGEFRFLPIRDYNTKNCKIIITALFCGYPIFNIKLLLFINFLFDFSGSFLGLFSYGGDSIHSIFDKSCLEDIVYS